MLFRKIVKVNTKKGISVTDVTKNISDMVKKCGISDGLCSIFLPAATAGLVVNENDRMLIEDFRRFFSAVDEKRPYNHPSNAFSHLRASMCKAELTIPVSSGDVYLGKWQRILLWEFDTKNREREIIVTVIS